MYTGHQEGNEKELIVVTKEINGFGVWDIGYKETAYVEGYKYVRSLIDFYTDLNQALETAVMICVAGAAYTPIRKY